MTVEASLVRGVLRECRQVSQDSTDCATGCAALGLVRDATVATLVRALLTLAADEDQYAQRADEATISLVEAAASSPQVGAIIASGIMKGQSLVARTSFLCPDLPFIVSTPERCVESIAKRATRTSLQVAHRLLSLLPLHSPCRGMLVVALVRAPETAKSLDTLLATGSSTAALDVLSLAAELLRRVPAAGEGRIIAWRQCIAAILGNALGRLLDRGLPDIVASRLVTCLQRCVTLRSTATGGAIMAAAADAEPRLFPTIAALATTDPSSSSARLSPSCPPKSVLARIGLLYLRYPEKAMPPSYSMLSSTESEWSKLALPVKGESRSSLSPSSLLPPSLSLPDPSLIGGLPLMLSLVVVAMVVRAMGGGQA